MAFARVLNAAIQADSRPLRALSDALPKRSFISPAALSQWQNGRAVPRLTLDTLHRVHALERLLRLPSCAAARALYVSNQPQGLPVAPIIPQPRTGDDGPPKAFEQAALQLEQKIAALYGSDNTAMPLVATHDHFVVGSKRWPLQSLVKLTVNPLREGIEHYWVVYAHSEKAPLTIEPMRGCASGHVVDDLPPVHINGEQQLLVATELTFPTLRAGEDSTFEFSMKYGPVPGGALPEPLFQRFVTTPALREVRLDIKFEGVRPRDLRSVRWPLTPANQSPIEQVPVKVDDEGHGEPITLTDPELAAYGYTWKWQSEYEALW